MTGYDRFHILSFLALIVIISGKSPTAVFSFVPTTVEDRIRDYSRNRHPARSLPTRTVVAAGKGFGTFRNDNNNGFNNNRDNVKPIEKSYGKEALSPISDLIDEESCMREFFLSNEEWQPLFRSIASDGSVPAMSFMAPKTDTEDKDFEFHEQTSPWRRLNPIPTQEDDQAVLAEFLDAVQKSLIDIPVDETTKEDDENDIHFMEEGRRMLVCSRFHVVHGMRKASIDSFDSLFATCWSEVKELRTVNENDTGSLIVVPGFDYDDLRRFADINLQRPLQWLGIHNEFEVASMERGGLSVVRLIHKLSDIPTDIAPAEPTE